MSTNLPMGLRFAKDGDQLLIIDKDEVLGRGTYSNSSWIFVDEMGRGAKAQARDHVTAACLFVAALANTDFLSKHGGPRDLDRRGAPMTILPYSLYLTEDCDDTVITDKTGRIVGRGEGHKNGWTFVDTEDLNVWVTTTSVETAARLFAEAREYALWLRDGVM